jgi:hypothetical protein
MTKHLEHGIRMAVVPRAGYKECMSGLPEGIEILPDQQLEISSTQLRNQIVG